MDGGNENFVYFLIEGVKSRCEFGEDGNGDHGTDLLEVRVSLAKKKEVTYCVVEGDGFYEAFTVKYGQQKCELTNVEGLKISLFWHSRWSGWKESAVLRRWVAEELVRVYKIPDAAEVSWGLCGEAVAQFSIESAEMEHRGSIADLVEHIISVANNNLES